MVVVDLAVQTLLAVVAVVLVLSVKQLRKVEVVTEEMVYLLQ